MAKSLFIAFVLLVVTGFMPDHASAQSGTGWTAPKLGVWRVTGKDEEGLKWTGSMRLSSRRSAGNTARYRGYFDWLSSDRKNSGREFFNAVFDRRSGSFRVNGYRVTRVKGDIAEGRYRGRAAGNGRRIVRGTWGGVDIIKGKWTAVWSRVR